MVFLEVLVAACLIVLNGLLAMSELAIVSSRPVRLRRLVEQDVRGSRRALALAADPGRLFSTVQIGITLVGVASGAFSGATLGLRLATWLTSAGLPQYAADVLGVGIVVALITYASLIVGELVPKRVALQNPEGIAVRVAPAMTILARVASPLVWLLDNSGRLLLAVLGRGEAPQQKVSEEEIRTLVAEAEHAGVLELGEREMIAAVMRLGDRRVGAIMTPRREVDLLDLSRPPHAIQAVVTESGHSRLPVHDGNPDEVIGIIQAKDVLDACLAGRAPDWRRLVRQAPVIPDSAGALDALKALKQSPVHLGLIHDEYGHFEGVVTTADILEAIAGVFRTEEGAEEPALVRRSDGSFAVSGWMPVDEFAETLGLVLSADRKYQTVAGFLLEGFGSLPAVGDSFDAQGWRFEVLDLDGRRVDKIVASRTPPTRRAPQRKT